jgi:hypothetical protein
VKKGKEMFHARRLIGRRVVSYCVEARYVQYEVSAIGASQSETKTECSRRERQTGEAEKSENVAQQAERAEWLAEKV